MALEKVRVVTRLAVNFKEGDRLNCFIEGYEVVMDGEREEGARATFSDPATLEQVAAVFEAKLIEERDALQARLDSIAELAR